MRKIERKMVNAIMLGKNWKSGNTEVFVNDNGCALVYLYGNHIASVTDKKVTLFDGGWRTATTKSRLNAVCHQFCKSAEGVFQDNFNWFVHRMIGNSNGTKVYNSDPFYSGYTLDTSCYGDDIPVYCGVAIG